VARGELRLAANLRVFVPGAHREAVVAAVDAVTHEGTQLAWDRALVLDGEVGDAAPRIEAVGRGECRGRAHVEAGAAASAVVGLARIRRQLERGEDRTEEQPGAELARHQIGVLALPAKPGLSG